MGFTPLDPRPFDALAARNRADCQPRAAVWAGTLLNPDFATFDNAMNVLTRTAFIGIIAVGMCFVIISGGIDLSSAPWRR